MLTKNCLAVIVIFLLFASSCGGANNGKRRDTISVADSQTQTTRQNTASSHNPHTRNQITDSMLVQIIDYYRKEYKSDSTQMNISRSDTFVEISFADTTEDPDKFHGSLFSATVSLVTDINPVICGDMNKDGISDMLVVVHTEGGGGGGNVWWSDHFMFLTDAEGHNKLADVKSDGEIMNGSGYFDPQEIDNQIIKGIGNSYADTDGRCCPSLYYRMQVGLIKGHLKTIGEHPIPKPAEYQ